MGANLSSGMAWPSRFTASVSGMRSTWAGSTQRTAMAIGATSRTRAGPTPNPRTSISPFSDSNSAPVETAARLPDLAAVVGDQRPAHGQQAQGEVALAGAGRPLDQNPPPPGRIEPGDQARVQDHARPSGRVTMNRAPSTRPSPSVRFSARMVPPWASTTCRAMDRPSPEWPPNAAPLGRAV